MTLRVLLADDELLARKRMARLLSALAGIELVATCSSGDEVLERLPACEVDVLLLDIRMPGLSGLDVAALVDRDDLYVIFTTAHAEHALEAFDVGAVDYLLKPISAVRLQLALERAARVLAGQRTSPAQHGASDADDGALPLTLERLAIETRAGVELIAPGDVSHAVIDGELVTVHTRQGRRLITDQPLSALERRLPAERFLRVHRRALVNVACVEVLEPNDVGGYTARMTDGEPVIVSRAAARRLRRWLGL